MTQASLEDCKHFPWKKKGDLKFKTIEWRKEKKIQQTNSGGTSPSAEMKTTRKTRIICLLPKLLIS